MADDNYQSEMLQLSPDANDSPLEEGHLCSTALRNIFYSCVNDNKETASAKDLITFVKPFLAQNQTELSYLQTCLDPESNNSMLTEVQFFECMHLWMSKVRESGSTENSRNCELHSFDLIKTRSFTSNVPEMNESNASGSSPNSGINYVQELSAEQEKNMELIYQNRKLVEELILVKSQLSSCEEHNEQLQGDLQSLVGKLSLEQHVNEQIQKEREENEELRDGYEVLVKMKHVLEKNLTTVEKEKQTIEQKLKSLEQQHQALEDKFEQKKKTEIEMERVLVELRTERDYKEALVLTMEKTLHEMQEKFMEKEQLIEYQKNVNENLRTEKQTMEKLLKHHSFLPNIPPLPTNSSGTFINNYSSPSSPICIIRQFSISDPPSPSFGQEAFAFNSPKLENMLKNPVSPNLSKNDSSENFCKEEQNSSTKGTEEIPFIEPKKGDGNFFRNYRFVGTPQDSSYESNAQGPLEMPKLRLPHCKEADAKNFPANSLELDNSDDEVLTKMPMVLLPNQNTTQYSLHYELSQMEISNNSKTILDQVQNERDQLKKQLDLCMGQIKLYESKISERDAKEAELRNINEEYEEEAQCLMKEKTYLQQENKKNREEANKLKQELVSLKLIQQDQENDFNECAKEINLKLEKKQDDLQKEFKRVDEKNRELANDVANKNEALDSLKNHTHNIAMNLSELSIELKNVKEKNIDMENMVMEKETELASLMIANNELNELLKKRTEMETILRDKITDFEYEVENLKEVSKENEQLVAKLKEEENTKKEYSRKIKEFENQFHDLEHKILLIVQQLDFKDDSITDFQNLLKDKNNIVEKLEKAIANKENNVHQAIQKVLTDKEDNIRGLEALITSLNWEIQNKEELLKDFQKMLDEKEEKVKDLEKMNFGLKEKIEMKEEVVRTIQNELSYKNVSIQTLINSVNKLEEDIKIKEETYQRQIDDLKEIEKTLAEKDEYIQNINEKLTQKQNSYSEMEDTLLKLYAELGGQERRRHALQKKILALKKQSLMKENYIRSIQRKFSEVLETLNENKLVNEALEKRSLDLQEQLENEEKILQNNQKIMEQTIIEKNEVIDRLKIDMNERDGEIDRLRKEMEDEKRKCKLMENELDEREENIQEMEEKEKNLRRNLKEQKDYVVQLKDSNNKFNEMIEKLQDQKDTKIESLEVKMTEQEVLIEKLKGFESESHRLIKLLEELSLEMEKLRQTLHDKEKKIKQLENLNKQKEEFANSLIINEEDLKETIDHLEHKLSKKSSRKSSLELLTNKIEKLQDTIYSLERNRNSPVQVENAGRSVDVKVGNEPTEITPLFRNQNNDLGSLLPKLKTYKSKSAEEKQEIYEKFELLIVTLSTDSSSVFSRLEKLEYDLRKAEDAAALAVSDMLGLVRNSAVFVEQLGVVSEAYANIISLALRTGAVKQERHFAYYLCTLTNYVCDVQRDLETVTTQLENANKKLEQIESENVVDEIKNLLQSSRSNDRAKTERNATDEIERNTLNFINRSDRFLWETKMRKMVKLLKSNGCQVFLGTCIVLFLFYAITLAVSICLTHEDFCAPFITFSRGSGQKPT